MHGYLASIRVCTLSPFGLYLLSRSNPLPHARTLHEGRTRNTLQKKLKCTLVCGVDDRGSPLCKDISQNAGLSSIYKRPGVLSCADKATTWRGRPLYAQSSTPVDVPPEQLLPPDLRVAAAAMVGLLTISGAYAALNLQSAWQAIVSLGGTPEVWLLRPSQGSWPLLLPRPPAFALGGAAAALISQFLLTCQLATIATGRFARRRKARRESLAAADVFLGTTASSVCGAFIAMIGLVGSLVSMMATATSPAVLQNSVLYRGFVGLHVHTIGAQLCTTLAHLSVACFATLLLQMGRPPKNVS